MSILRSVRDKEWIRNAFLAHSYNQEERALRAATFSTADSKFVSTKVGGNICINPLPQFCRAADIRRPGLGNYGNALGRYYNDAYDNHNQIVHFRMGVPSFNSLLLFVSNFYNGAAGRMARTGQGPSWLYRLGEAAGFVVGVMSWKIQAVRLVGQAYGFFAQKGSSKFYTVKPTMPMYWNAVQTIVNQIAVNTGIVPRIGGEGQAMVKSASYEFPSDMRAKLTQAMPDIFHSSGSIDVYAIANRAQRMARRQMQAVENALEGSNDVRAAFRIMNEQKVDVGAGGHLNYETYLENWFASTPSGANSQVTPENDDISKISDLQAGGTGFWEFLKAEFDDGSAFVSFRVNYTGPISESFSNTTGESELGAKLNNMASSARNLKFTLAGGNVAPGVDAVVQGVTDFVQGAADSVGLGGVVSAMTGGAYVDIPNVWRGSTAQMPKASYNIVLTTIYNHPIAQLLYVYLPMAMLLAMAMPLSTGKQSYTSPFILEYYDKGRSQSRLAIVDSLSFTRGIHTLGFNADHRPLGIEATLSIADLSNVIHMPIAMGISLVGMAFSSVNNLLAGVTASGIFDDDTAFTDYMATLSSLGLADQIYPLRKLKLNLTREMVKWESMTSPARLAGIMGDSLPGRLVSIFYAGTVR